MKLSKVLLRGALLVWAGMVAWAAVPVTFQVDMTRQIALGAFDPGVHGVEVRGEFTGWNGGQATLAPSAGNANIYTGTFSLNGDPGTNVKYKFVRTPGDGWESSPDRTVTLTDSAQTIGVVFFNDDAGLEPVMSAVTFRVNMASQIAAAGFNPATDTVSVRGEFNGWGAQPLTAELENPDIYSATVDVTRPPDASVQYKFHIQRPGSETWENDPNRNFTHKATAQSVPVVYFNNISGVPLKAKIKLDVNMNAQILNGAFTGTKEVWVRGNKVGWGNPPSGLQLIEDSTRPGIFTNTMVLAENLLTAEAIEFKFTIWDPNTSQTTWEDGANKVLTFTGSEPVDAEGFRNKSFGPVFFNGIAVNDLLAADTLVTFRVDMTNAKRFNTETLFDPLVEGVWINGPFVNNGSWGTWGSMDPDFQMSDDGTTLGDTVAGDKIYSFQRLYAKGSPIRVTYKYGIENGDNEGAFGTDHVRFIRAVGTYVFPVDTFGVSAPEPSFGNLTIAKGAGGSVNISWLGRPGVRLQKVDLNSGAATDVSNTDGQSSLNYTMTGEAEFFRLVQP